MNLSDALYKQANPWARLFKTVQMIERGAKANRQLPGSGDRMLRQSNLLGGASVRQAVPILYRDSRKIREAFPNKAPTFRQLLSFVTKQHKAWKPTQPPALPQAPAPRRQAWFDF